MNRKIKLFRAGERVRTRAGEREMSHNYAACLVASAAGEIPVKCSGENVGTARLVLDGETVYANISTVSDPAIDFLNGGRPATLGVDADLNPTAIILGGVETEVIPAMHYGAANPNIDSFIKHEETETYNMANNSDSLKATARNLQKELSGIEAQIALISLEQRWTPTAGARQPDDEAAWIERMVQAAVNELTADVAAQREALDKMKATGSFSRDPIKQFDDQARAYCKQHGLDASNPLDYRQAVVGLSKRGGNSEEW